jgi:hypothetical protein
VYIGLARHRYAERVATIILLILYIAYLYGSLYLLSQLRILGYSLLTLAHAGERLLLLILYYETR